MAAPTEPRPWLRCLDIVLAAVGLVLASPVIALIALGNKIEDWRAPVFFRQVRVGEGGRPFRIIKFRTMTHDPNRFVGTLDIEHWRSLTWDEKVALRRAYRATASGDSRITRLGRLLRKTSLDELPQLWNVLVGDMSLVGPRPDAIMQEVDYQPEEWQERIRVKPGITGLAQVNGRSRLSAEERLACDLRYVRGRSVVLYLQVLVRTVSEVFGKHAN